MSTWCMSTKATKYIICKQVDYKTCRHIIKGTTKHKSHWASALYRNDRWTNMSISTHIQNEQVGTWHMAIKAIWAVMVKQVGYESCKIYIEMVYDAYDM